MGPKWYETLFTGHAETYEKETLTQGTLGESDFIESVIVGDRFVPSPVARCTGLDPAFVAIGCQDGATAFSPPSTRSSRPTSGATWRAGSRWAKIRPAT